MFRHKIFLRNTLTLENSKSKFTASPPLLRERPRTSAWRSDDHANDAAGKISRNSSRAAYTQQESQYKANRHTNRIPKVRNSLRAKDARSNSAMRPLTVDPTIMAASWTRTAGVNHLSPVNASEQCPSRSPAAFIHHIPPSRSVFLVFLTTNREFLLSLSVHKKQDRYPHHQIRPQSTDKEA